MIKQIITDSLGFRLDVTVSIGDFENLGRHITYQDELGKVPPDAGHKINIKNGLEADVLYFVVSHEVYHLFYSIRHLITADEEVEAEVFGELVKRVLQMAFEAAKL